jgi:hypothetical protein
MEIIRGGFAVQDAKTPHFQQMENPGNVDFFIAMKAGIKTYHTKCQKNCNRFCLMRDLVGVGWRA